MSRSEYFHFRKSRRKHKRHREHRNVPFVVSSSLDLEQPHAYSICRSTDRRSAPAASRTNTEIYSGVRLADVQPRSRGHAILSTKPDQYDKRFQCEARLVLPFKQRTRGPWRKP